MTNPIRRALARSFAVLLLLGLATPAFAQEFDAARDREVVEAIQKAEARKLAAFANKRTEPDTSGWDAVKYTIRYDVNLSSRNVSARVTVDGAATEAGLASVSLDFVGFAISSVTVGGAAAQYNRENNGRALRVQLPRALGVGETFSIEVTYSGVPQTEGALGLGFTANGAATFAEPEGARLWFPCKDRPSDKAQYEGFITVASNLVVASNGLLVATTNNGGKKTYHWRENNQIATYLISLAISDYVVIEESYRGIPVWHYVYPSREQAARRDFSRTTEMMRAFEERLGVDYPFDKYGHALFEAFGGAMEHQSCSSYGATLITGDNRYDLVVAHELGHQWFGDLVSPAEWEEIWLNEGFASWTEFLWMEWWNPGSLNALKQSRENAYMDYETRVQPYALYGPPRSLLFGTTIYQKGAWVVSMLRYHIGDEAFFAGIRLYLERHEGKSAKTTDLKAAMEEASGRDLTPFFDEWVFGISYPRYETSWSTRIVPGGRHQVDLRVRQTQRTPTVFTTPLEVEIVGQGGERHRQRVEITSADSIASICLDFAPSRLTVDPDNMILGPVTAATGSVAAQPAVCADQPDAISIASVSYKKNKLTVTGTGFLTGDSVVEVDGVELAKTKYPKRYRNPDGTTNGVVGKQKGLGQELVPSGATVQVTILNRATGLRSAPFAFTRN